MLKKLKTFFLWLLCTFAVYYLAVIIIFFIRGGSTTELMEMMGMLFIAFVTAPLFYVFLLIPYLVYLFVKYLISIRRRKGWGMMFRMTFLLAILPIGLIFGAFRGIMWYNYQENYQYEWNTAYENLTGKSEDQFQVDGKHRGIHVFLRGQDREEEIQQMIRNNVEWITLVPYSYQENVLKPSLRFTKRESYSRRDSSFIRTIKIARANQMQVLMKPHIWVTGDLWRSEIAMDTEEEWLQWFAQYEAFIMHYARMAEATGCAALCVGTELMKSALERPEDWRKLIRNVKTVYSGELIYAANWDREYKEITFWDELDYIGVQAYFGLSDKDMPELAQICEGWIPHKKALYKIHRKWNKPVLFTEVGYKSTMGAAHKPWLWESSFGSISNKISLETQANCYEALFHTFWDEPWFAGVHLWRWEGENKFDFTPKNKPAANIMAKWFSKDSRDDGL